MSRPRLAAWLAARVQPTRLRAKAAKAKGRWNEVLEHCEDAFVHNPWDVTAAQDAADAAAHLNRPELAKWLLESVHAQAGEEAGFLRHLARVYELNENWEQAIACWERVRRVDPNDENALRQIKALSASATITRSGLGAAIQRSEQKAPEEAFKSDLDDLKRQALSPEDRLRREMEEEPDRVGTYLELVDLLKLNNRLDEAERILAKGLQAVPGDDILHTAHADIQIARLQRAIGVWTKKARDQPDDPPTQAKLDQLKGMLADYEIKEYRRRIEKRPQDMNLHYQLGLRLCKNGRYDEAIAEFQQARAAPALKVSALYQAGLCFESKGLPKLAERNYQEALNLVDTSDQALVNSLHYRLGRAAESHGDLKSAEEHYNEVAANDYTFEDVAHRLENLNRESDS